MKASQSADTMEICPVYPKADEVTRRGAAASASTYHDVHGEFESQNLAQGDGALQLLGPYYVVIRTVLRNYSHPTSDCFHFEDGQDE
jgi:hypothetical protein